MPRKPHGPTARLMATALLAVVASLVIAACGGSSKSSPTQNASNPPTTSVATTATAATTPPARTTTSPATTTTPATTTPATTPPAKRVVSLRACLAAHGIHLPYTGANPLALLQAAGKLPKGTSRTHYEEAVRTCVRAQLAPSGRTVKPSRVTNPRVIGALRRFAACMRQHGVNLADPNTSGKGPIFNTKGLDTTSPQFRSALVTCSANLREVLKASPGRGGAAPLG